jgi:hypothetical protein
MGSSITRGIETLDRLVGNRIALFGNLMNYLYP